MHRLAFLLLLATGVAALQAAGGRTLACDRSEAAALRTAPAGVHRSSKHRLTIRWAHGTRVLFDAGVAAGEIGGTAYEYCASGFGYHLIRKADDGLFTGVLLDTATGKLIPAGQVVIFAPDGTQYFATQQPDGLDGEEWLLYSQTGGRLWKGLAGITAKSPAGGYDYFIATLEQPHWSSAGDLVATLRCASDTTQTASATLRPVAGGFRWMPPGHCAPIP